MTDVQLADSIWSHTCVCVCVQLMKSRGALWWCLTSSWWKWRKDFQKATCSSGTTKCHLTSSQRWTKTATRWWSHLRCVILCLCYTLWGNILWSMHNDKNIFNHFGSLLSSHSSPTTSCGRWTKAKAAWLRASTPTASLTTCSPTRTAMETEKSQRPSSSLKQTKPLLTMSYDGTECQTQVRVWVEGQTGGKMWERKWVWSQQVWGGKRPEKYFVFLYWGLRWW